MEGNGDDQLLSEIGDDLGKKLTLESTSEHFNDDDEEDDVVYVFNSGDDDDDEDEEGEFEFSFAGVEVKSPKSAEVLFENGQIRPSFPFIVENSEETSEKFGPPVKKLFVVPPSTAEDGEWRAGESPAEVAAAGSSSPEFRRKSNSTGFSRFWRMKELLARSNSDGKDRFVFMPSSKEGSGGVEKEKTKMKSMMKVVSLRRIKVGKKNENNETRPTNGGGGGGGGDKEGKKKGKKAASMSAAYEAFYGKKSGSSGSGGGEKSSYLPYRVGFFTNASGMTRNVHPY